MKSSKWDFLTESTQLTERAHIPLRTTESFKRFRKLGSSPQSIYDLWCDLVYETFVTLFTLTVQRLSVECVSLYRCGY